MKKRNKNKNIHININNRYQRLKQKRLYIALLIVVVVAFILGILFLAVVSKANKELVKESLDTFFNSVKTDKLDYLSGLFSSLGNTVGINLVMWVLGISVVGIPLIIFLIFFKSFTLGFSLSSIVYFYGFKGILIGIIYIIPNLISIFVYIVMGFYAISFSRHLFNLIFRKKEIIFKKLTTRYLKVLGISTLILIGCSILEIYLVPMILKTMIG